ncbi:Cytokinin riboside 5'-monophosphate phosphoribohydrolase LOG [Gracilaria domingensis]|nr:Cytokinin riboside 5'-monophosphate phosphoribohydrolase LOG [Gracilaria domingensis]
MTPPPQNHIQTVTVYAASGARVHESYLRDAYELGAENARTLFSLLTASTFSRQAIAHEGWVQVNGGGKTGLMGAATQGALDANGVVDCVTMRAFVDEGLSKRYRHVQVEETIQDRKAGLAQRADAFVTLPGGLGTLDELAEQMCARQLGTHVKPIIVLNTNGFFDTIRQFIRNGEESLFIAPGMLKVVCFVDTLEEVVQCLKEYTPTHISKSSINSSELNALRQ